MARLCNHEWSPPADTAAPPRAAVTAAKPKGGARLLSFLIQGAVMAVALALFFLFAGVAALILLHLFVAGRAFRLRRRRRAAATQGAAAAADGGVDDRPLRGLSPADLRRLPWFEYSPSPPRPRPDCAVCLEGIRARERCRALPPCGHVFHAACVDRWLVKSPACPICRAAVAAAAAAAEEIARTPRRWYISQSDAIVEMNASITSGSSASATELENDAFIRINGKDRYGRVRGYGIGVVPTQVFGPQAYIGNVRYDDNIEKVQRLKSKIQLMQDTYESKLVGMQEEYESKLDMIHQNYESRMSGMQSQLNEVTSILLNFVRPSDILGAEPRVAHQLREFCVVPY